MAQVALENVSKVFPGGVQAVNQLSLRVQDGEFLVLVGPSGCGKSTVLRLIAGLEELTAGHIRIGDRLVDDLAPKDRDIAMVFQSYALYPHMTVYKNMSFGLRLRKLPKQEIDRRVRDAAGVLGIQALLGRKPQALSGGQRQRVAVGRAIVRKPKAFLFDEPLSNLDAKLRVEMRAELKRLHRTLGTTTIYVTHDQEEAMTLGRRIAVLRDGVLHQCGPPLEVYATPTDRFVAGFIGAPPMNFLDGRLGREDGRALLKMGQETLHLPSALAEPLGEWFGREVVLGVRPSAIDLAPAGERHGGGDLLGARVIFTELFGENMNVHCRLPDDQPLVARLKAGGALEGDQEIVLRLELSKAHVFEPGPAGANLTAGRGGAKG